MKKSLLLLFSLLIFVGNVWGFSHNLFNNQEQHVKAKGKWDSGYVETTFNYHCLTTLKFKVASGTWNYDFDFKVECYDSSGNLVNSYEGSGAGKWSWSKPYYEKTYNISCNVAKVKLINTNSVAALYFKEVCVEGVDDYFTIDNTQARNFGTKTIKSEYPINVTVSYSASTSDVSVSGEGFSINKSTLGSASGCASTDYVTVTFSPQAPKNYSGTLTIGGTKIELSGIGSLAVPQNLSVETPTNYTSARLTWDAVEGADKYYVYINGNKINDEPSTNSINLTNLTPKTTYSNVYVKSVAVENNVDYPSNASSSVEFTTKAINIPQNVTCKPDYLSATLTWDAVSDKSNYGVVKDGVKYYYAVYKDNVWVADTQSEQYTIENLQWGDNNCGSYTVKTYAFSTTSDASNACNVNTKTLLAPTGVSVSNIGYDNATVTWNAATAATSYKVYLSADGGISYSQYGKDVTEAPLKMEFTNLDLDKKYYVKVESVLNGKETATAQDVNFSTNDLVAPANFAVREASYSSIALKWDVVTDATGYQLTNITTKQSIDIEGGNYSDYVFTGLQPTTTYQFRLTPVYNGVLSNNSATTSGTTIENPDVPVTSACVSWSDYEEQTLRAYIINEAVKYNFKKKVYKSNVTFSAKCLGSSVALKNTNLEASTDGGSTWTTIWYEDGNIDSDFKEFTVALPEGTDQVRFRNGVGSSLWRTYSYLYVSRRNELSVNSTSLQFGAPYIGQSVERTVSIDYANNAVMTYSIDGNQAFTANGPSLDECAFGTNAICTVTYQPTTLDEIQQASLFIYNGLSKSVSLTGDVLQLPAPENFVISEQNPTSTVLTWDDVNITETGYKVVCKQGDNVIETKDLVGDVTTCTFEGLTPNVEYTFTITTMYNTIENGSATISGSTTQLPAPQNFNITNVLSARADASWNEVASATGYRLTWTDGADSNGSVDLDSDVLNYVITDLIPNREYTATVATLYDGNVHGTSDEQTFTTSCVVRTAASGDEVKYQSHNIEFISGTQLADGSYLKGSVIRYTSSTSSENIRFVQINVDGTIYTTPSIEITINGNVHIESRYEYKGIAEVIDDKVYDTLNEAVEAVHDGGTINLLGDVPTQDLSVSGKHIEFNGNGHSISNLYIESDGSVDLIGDVVVVNDFGLEISTSNSGQFTQTNAQIEVRGKAYVDKILDNSGVGDYNKWYSVAVPFPVSIANGIYILDNNGNEIKKAVLNKDYAIFEYDSELRAKGTSRLPEWKLAATENMKLGTFYLLGLGYSGPNVYRFYKLDDADLITAENQLEIKSYPASNPKNAGWNGIGNTKLFHIGIESPANNYAQVLEGNKFITVSLEDSKFAVTTPMFIQSDENTIATLSPKHNGSLRSVSASSDTYNLRIAKENADGYADQMFVSASDNVMEQYTIGKDLSKFEVSSLYPQIYTMAYGTALSVHEAAYNDKNIAEMPLYMFAPEAGNYTLSLGKDVLDGTALYLVKDGAEIHNFSNDGAYTLYLAKGTTSTYSLRISAATSDVPTIVEDENGSEIKIYVKEGVLVIEGLGIGESYNVGNMVRTLYYGVSNGGNITVPLSEQGVYWVKTGNKVVKVLNK